MSKIDPFFTIDAEWRLGSATVYAGSVPIGKVSMFTPDRFQFHCCLPGAPSRAYLGQTWIEAVLLYFYWVACKFGPFEKRR